LDKELSGKIANIMDQQFNEGFFTYYFEYLKSMNYYFEIHSDWARGNKELLMSSIITHQQISPEIEETISLLSRKFANEIQSNKDIFTGLYINELSNYNEADKGRIKKNEALIKTRVNNLYSTVVEDTREKFDVDIRKILPGMDIKKQHILVISEEPEIISLAKKFLKLGDYKTIITTNPNTALKILKDRYSEISMVLLDTMISHHGANTLLEEIKSIEEYKDIHVVLFSSKNDNGDDFFPYPYIFKPPTPPDDLGLEGQLQAKEPNDKEPVQFPYCKYCGGILVKGESVCHVCGNKVL
jgi:CheY-like chemotaxis protein